MTELATKGTPSDRLRQSSSGDQIRDQEAGGMMDIEAAMNPPAMTNAESLEYLISHGSRGDFVRYVFNHPRLRGVKPGDRAALAADFGWLVDAAFERGETLARQNLAAAFTDIDTTQARKQ